MNQRRIRSTRHGEYKERVNLMLTPTAITNLDERAETLKLSRSELVEQLARMELSDELSQRLGEFCAV